MKKKNNDDGTWNAFKKNFPEKANAYHSWAIHNDIDFAYEEDWNQSFDCWNHGFEYGNMRGHGHTIEASIEAANGTIT